MEFLVMWLGTIIASFGIELAHELRMFKDVADAGYKVDVERILELRKQLNPAATEDSFLSMLIPGFNIIQVFKKTIQYNNTRPMILDQLNVLDALEEMSEIEKAEYQKKPTGLNAAIVPLKFEKRLSKAHSIDIKEGFAHSKIYYEMGNSLDDITILKVEGSAFRSTDDEQKQMVISAWEDLVHAGIGKYGNEKALINALKETKNLDLTYFNTDDMAEAAIEESSQATQDLKLNEQSQASEDTKYELPEAQGEVTLQPSQELNIIAQKQGLEDLKSELLKGQENTPSTDKAKKKVNKIPH